MARAIAESRLSREIKNLTRPKLLIIDEVGYLTLEQAHASLLFQAIYERYEKRQAIIFTSNKAFADWARSSQETPSWPRPPWTACCTAPPASMCAATAIASKKNASPTPPPWTQRPCHAVSGCIIDISGHVAGFAVALHGADPVFTAVQILIHAVVQHIACRVIGISIRHQACRDDLVVGVVVRPAVRHGRLRPLGGRNRSAGPVAERIVNERLISTLVGTSVCWR